MKHQETFKPKLPKLYNPHKEIKIVSPKKMIRLPKLPSPFAIGKKNKKY